MNTYITVKKSKSSYKFINIKKLRDEAVNIALWVTFIGGFLYCIFA